MEIKKKETIQGIDEIAIPSCKNCEWAGCKNYGKDKHSCNKYIKEFD